MNTLYSPLIYDRQNRKLITRKRVKQRGEVSGGRNFQTIDCVRWICQKKMNIWTCLYCALGRYRSTRLRSSKQKTYNKKFMRNSEMKLLLKGKFKRSTVCDGRINQKRFKQHEVKDLQSMKLETDRLNGTTTLMCNFSCRAYLEWKHRCVD